MALRESGPQALGPETGEFLEGIDVRDDEFEDWLTLERSYWQQMREARMTRPAETLPAAIVHSIPAQGTLKLSMGGHTIEIRILPEPALA